MTIGPRPVCLDCRHYRGTRFIEAELRSVYCCDAFPDGIPEDILCGSPHDRPRKGDHGIRFEPKGESEFSE